MANVLKPTWLGLYAFCFLIFLYGPVLLLPLFSFNDSIYITFPLKGFTFDWYRQMAQNQQMIEALKASLKVATSVSLICTCLGFIAAKAVTQFTLPGRALVVGFLMLPLVIPSLVLALALLVVVRKLLGLDLSLVTVAAGHVMLCVPFSMLILISRLEGFDRSLEEAAYDLGDSTFKVLYRVTLPLVWPAIVSSLLLCFTASFDEYLLAAFLSGSEGTLPVFIFSQLRFPQNLPGVLALGSCILLGSVFLVTLAEVVRRRGVPESTSAGTLVS
ncbi:spermidine/putrescine ABC transporter [Mesorhizobium hungaricum]|uniref:Spermidine/putrescine ABC transporter n=1 Tax=Mesorhizobium hungaricum TaxID=1566387 RepID=A0A1C2E3H2_9HYPH|nr:MULTISPECIES: ABC transporter permease [Mesorhizobium]MBN9235897.1 ABC transporter permease [Mesorhizobium sp.]OCX21554.1 spermidine/putrescine ABC transporter [Mesorhizobium hungaricum]